MMIFHFEYAHYMKEMMIPPVIAQIFIATRLIGKHIIHVTNMVYICTVQNILLLN